MLELIAVFVEHSYEKVSVVKFGCLVEQFFGVCSLLVCSPLSSFHNLPFLSLSLPSIPPSRLSLLSFRHAAASSNPAMRSYGAL